MRENTETIKKFFISINILRTAYKKEINIKNDSLIKDLIAKVKMDPIWTIKYYTGGSKKRNAYNNGIGQYSQ